VNLRLETPTRIKEKRTQSLQIQGVEIDNNQFNALLYEEA
jgi:hypothetical protein